MKLQRLIPNAKIPVVPAKQTVNQTLMNVFAPAVRLGCKIRVATEGGRL